MSDEVKIKPPWASIGTDSDPEMKGPSLLEPEFAPAYNAYATSRNPETAGAFLKAVHPVLTEATRSYAGAEAATPTVMANAKRLALEAARRYDPTRAKLRTHLLSHLRGIRRQVAQSTSGIRVPEQWKLDSQRLSSIVPDLRDQLGREPSHAEIADHAGIGIDRVRKAQSVPGVLSSGQVGDSVESVPRDEEAWKVWTEAIYHDSGPIDQVIMDHSLGIHGNPVLSGNEIAKKLGLSAGAVSQRRLKLQQQLDQFEQFMGRTAKG